MVHKRKPNDDFWFGFYQDFWICGFRGWIKLQRSTWISTKIFFYASFTFTFYFYLFFYGLIAFYQTLFHLYY